MFEVILPGDNGLHVGRMDQVSFGEALHEIILRPLKLVFLDRVE